MGDLEPNGGAGDATETSSLLTRRENGTSAAPAKSNGTFPDANGAQQTGHDDGEREAQGGNSSNGNSDGSVGHEGIPEVAAKLPILIPAVGIGIFLCALDQLLTVATYAKIGSDLGALNSTGWIATAYFLTLTSCQPLYGKLSDIFGRKECLLFSYVMFALGCLWCGVAQDMTQLILARAVAGVGGGGMNAVVSILITDIVPMRDRGIWQGYINIIFASGTSVGAPLGGLLADSVGWRWSFLGQVPLCAAAFIAVYFVLHLPPRDSSHWFQKLARIDFLGAFFLVAAVFSLLLGLDNASNERWEPVYTIVLLAISPALFLIFIAIEVKVASHPFTPGHIIFERSLSACFACNFFGPAGNLPVLFFLPLLYQAAYGFSAVQAGLLLIPGSLLGVSGSLFAGFFIKRTGRYYWLTVACMASLLVSTVPLVVFGRSTAAWAPAGTVLGLVLASFGTGGFLTTTLMGLITNAAREDTAVVVACSYLFRSLGSSVGISAQSAILQRVLRAQLAERLPGVGVDPGEAARIGERVRESLDYIRELPPATAEVVRRCYQLGVVAVFALSAVPVALALISAFFIREKRIAK